jgi:hypothetical protein
VRRAPEAISASSVSTGESGSRSLNIQMRTALNPPGEIRIDRFGWTFYPGDKGHANRE